jgi:predicted alpha/beta superfamily hydrolase
VARLTFAGLAFLAAMAACSSSSTGDPAPAGGPPPGGTTPPGTAAPPATTPPPPQGPTPTTVRVHYAGKPGPMSLRGSSGPLSWDKGVPLAAEAKDAALYVWSSTDVKSDLELKPMLGETWSRGPNYRVKPGQTIDVYPRFFESRGTVTIKYPSFTSQKLPSTRSIRVYLPPTYVENTASRFGVLYMHDGQNLFSPETAFGGNEWKVDETLDAGAEDGSIREMIVVGVDNTPARIAELTPTPDPGYGGGKADQYLSMVIDEIKPRIDKDLRTLPNREDTAVMGSSLGGLVSVYAGVRRADVFGLVGSMSPSTWWDGRMILGEVATIPQKKARPDRIYVDSGDSGEENDDVLDTNDLAKKLMDVGYVEGKDLHHVVGAGDVHNEIAWAKRLPAALRFLLGPRPN